MAEDVFGVPATLVVPDAHEHLASPARGGGGLRLIYVHGINNKPTVDVLECQWDTAIFGQEIDAAQAAYWVNRTRYPVPRPTTCSQHDDTGDRPEPSLRLAHLAAVESQLGDLNATPEERAYLEELAAEMFRRGSRDESRSFSARGVDDWIVRSFLPDAHDFLFNSQRHHEIEKIFMDALASADRAIVISHSMGSIISYQVLRKMGASAPPVPLFLTLGSPLGLFAVIRILRKWANAGGGKLPKPARVERWINVAARGDIVAVDSDLADEFVGPEDARITNRYEDAHASSGYLESGPVRDGIRRITGP